MRLLTRITADFHFSGTFTYRTLDARRHAADWFAVEPAPIPPHALVVDGRTIRIDYRTSSMPAEWPSHLHRAALLGINATHGELMCTYAGPSDAGHRVQRVRLTPRGGRFEPVPSPTVIPLIPHAMRPAA